jgi:hypothetical protein
VTGAASVGLPMGMAQFVLLGDAAESALLRGEENDGMDGKKLILGESLQEKENAIACECMQVKESKASR